MLIRPCQSTQRKQKEDWVTDERLNLSKKKKNAWLLLCGVGKSDNSLKLKYHHLCKLTKAAAEKLEILGGVQVQLKQRSVPGLQSSVAMMNHLLGNSDY